MSLSPPKALKDYIQKVALSQGRRVVLERPDVVANSSRARQIATKLVARAGLPDPLPPQDLSRDVDLDLIYIDDYTILIGSLGKTPETHDDALQALHMKAGFIRTHLDASIESGMLMLLVGPWGSIEDQNWHDVARRTERDERICRKVVWLPPQERESNDEVMQTVIDRTFLATFWVTSQAAGKLDLDPASSLAAAMSEDFEKQTRLSSKVLERWLVILSNEQSDRVAELLVTAVEEESNAPLSSNG